MNKVCFFTCATSTTSIEYQYKYVKSLAFHCIALISYYTLCLQTNQLPKAFLTFCLCLRLFLYMRGTVKLTVLYNLIEAVGIAKAVFRAWLVPHSELRLQQRCAPRALGWTKSLQEVGEGHSFKLKLQLYFPCAPPPPDHICVFKAPYSYFLPLILYSSSVPNLLFSVLSVKAVYFATKG